MSEADAIEVGSVLEGKQYCDYEEVLKLLGVDDGLVLKKDNQSSVGRTLSLDMVERLLHFISLDAGLEFGKLKNDQVPTEKKVGTLLLISLANMVDGLFEAKDNPFDNLLEKELDVDELTSVGLGMSLDLGGELISIGDWLTGIDEVLGTGNVYEKMKVIMGNQIKWLKLSEGKLLNGYTIDEAMRYRSETLGEYYQLVAEICGDEDLVGVFARIQILDDTKDVLEDKQTQIQPFVALMEKYGINIDTHRDQLMTFGFTMKHRWIDTQQKGERGDEIWESAYFKERVNGFEVADERMAEFSDDLIRIFRFYLEERMIKLPDEQSI